MLPRCDFTRLVRPFAGWLDAAVVTVVVFSALVLHVLGDKMLDTLSDREQAAASLGRASHAILLTPYAVLSLLEYDDNTEAGREAPVLLLDSEKKAKNALAQASRLAPAKSAKIAQFARRFDELIEKAQSPFAIGNASPGLTRGAELSATELEQLASGAKLAAGIDVELEHLAGEVGGLQDALTVDNAAFAETLTHAADVAIGAAATFALAALAYVRAKDRGSVLEKLREWRTRRRRDKLLLASLTSSSSDAEDGAPSRD